MKLPILAEMLYWNVNRPDEAERTVVSDQFNIFIYLTNFVPRGISCSYYVAKV